MERFWWGVGGGTVSAVITAVGTKGDGTLIGVAFSVAAVISAAIGPTLVAFFGGDNW